MRKAAGLPCMLCEVQDAQTETTSLFAGRLDGAWRNSVRTSMRYRHWPQRWRPSLQRAMV